MYTKRVLFYVTIIFVFFGCLGTDDTASAIDDLSQSVESQSAANQSNEILVFDISLEGLYEKIDSIYGVITYLDLSTEVFGEAILNATLSQYSVQVPLDRAQGAEIYYQCFRGEMVVGTNSIIIDTDNKATHRTLPNNVPQKLLVGRDTVITLGSKYTFTVDIVDDSERIDYTFDYLGNGEFITKYSYSYAQPGTYTATAKAFDGFHEIITSVTIEVVNGVSSSSIGGQLSSSNIEMISSSSQSIPLSSEVIATSSSSSVLSVSSISSSSISESSSIFSSSSLLSESSSILSSSSSLIESSSIMSSSSVEPSFLLNFIKNGGTGTAPASTQYHEGDVIAINAPLTRSGFEFSGWSTTILGAATQFSNGDDLVMPAHGVSLTAQWAPLYLVVYNSNGGTGTGPIDNTVYSASEQVTVMTKNDLSFTRKKFVRWNSQHDGSGTNYSEGIDFFITSNVTLYAQWEDYIVGDSGPAGGYIFYDKQSVTNGWRYLEVTLSDESATAFDCAGTQYSFTVSGIGNGLANSEGIDGACVSSAGPVARSIDFTLNTYSDWFLPSGDEMKEIYTNMHLVGQGNFNLSDYYWVSNMQNNHTDTPQAMDFNYGYIMPMSSTYIRPYRPVRRF